MKILQVNASYKPAYIYGGPTMSVSKLSEELVKSGKDIQVFTTTADGEKELNVKAGLITIVDGVSVTYFKRITKGNSHLSPALLLSLWSNLRKVETLLNTSRSPSGHFKTCKTKIVHIHAWWNLVSVGSCIVAILLEKPVILSPRGTLSSYSFLNRKSLLKNIFHQIIGKALLNRCYFHVSTEKEKRDVLNLLHPKSIIVIPNFVRLPELKSINIPIQGEKNIFNLLFLSRIEEKKGLDVLLKELQLININWRLTIAGSGNSNYIEYLKALAIKLNIHEKLKWIGQQNHEQKFNVLASHDLVILPSHDESFANVVIESLSVGTPVIVSRKVGLAEYVQENNLGWVFIPNELELSECIAQSYMDLTKRLKIRSLGPTLIRKDYDEMKLLTSYIELYKNAAKNID